VKSKEIIMTTQRIKEQVSKYVFALEYVRDKCGKNGNNLVTAEFRRDTGLNAVAVKGMLHFGYIKKVSRGKYMWTAPDIVQPIMARNVYEFVKQYFRDNNDKRNEKVVEQPIENPVEDMHEEPDYIAGLIAEVQMLERMNQDLRDAFENVAKERDMYHSLYDTVFEELNEMRSNHNEIVKDIMDTPQFICSSLDNGPSSKSYYFFGLPIWSIKFK